MSKYLYPAIFSPEGDACNVSFPDLEGCYTFGDSLQNAYDMAEDALCLMLYDMEESSAEIPEASNITDIHHGDNEFVSLVACDTVYYREQHDNKLINKTVTIESWLNKLAERAHLNCSLLLRNAIKQELNIK